MARRLAAGALVVLVTVAATLVATAIVSRPEPPSGEDTASETETMLTGTVAREVLRRGVFLRARVIDNPERFPIDRSGVVTAMPKRAGDEVLEGDVVVEIQSRPVMLLYSPFPGWRDLQPGSRGRDVEMVQRALGRLGYPIIDEPGVFGPDTEAAVRDLYLDRGYEPPATGDGETELPPGEVLLAPEGVWLWSADGVEVGTVLVPGGPEVFLRRPGTRLQLDGVPGTIGNGTDLLVWTAPGAEPRAATVVDVLTAPVGADVDRQVVETEPPTAQLIGGRSGDVAVEVVSEATAGPVLAAPGTVVATGPDGGTYVERLADGTVERVPITVGFIGDELVELRSDRLEVGDELLLQR